MAAATALNIWLLNTYIPNTSTLKKVIDICIPAITRVINLSLDKGGFNANWKTAVVKPLIKSKQKSTIKSNY